MKRIHYYLFLLNISFSIPTFGQTACCNDKVIVFTDRTLYIAGESIIFNANVLSQNNSGSKVLYLELINSERQRKASGKFLIENFSVNGEILIPSDLLSGVYFLKAYTRWMRNFDISDYFFIPIKVINIESDVVDSPNIPGRDLHIPNQFKTLSQNKEQLYIDFPDSAMSPRKKVTLTIKRESSSANILSTVVSIAPAGSLSDTVMLVASQNISSNSNRFVKESNGLLISGTAVAKISGEAIPNKDINISILGVNSDIISSQTDSLGYFSIFLPYIKGKRDLYIGVIDGKNAEVKVDNDFCTRSFSLPNIPFYLSYEELESAKVMASNYQLSNFFNFNNTQNNLKDSRPTTLFYGTPEATFLFDNFISLLTIEEYFHEFLPEVSIKGKGQWKAIKLLGKQVEMSIYKPLVLLDMIPISDVESLLKAKPSLFSKIELVYKPYYKGDKIYGGIISFFSRNGDIAGIELPSTDLFLEFNFLSDEYTPIRSDFADNIPNTLNSIFITIPQNEETVTPSTLNFMTPDCPGRYVITMRSITDDGQILWGSSQFIVN